MRFVVIAFRKSPKIQIVRILPACPVEVLEVEPIADPAAGLKVKFDKPRAKSDPFSSGNSRRTLKSKFNNRQSRGRVTFQDDFIAKTEQDTESIAESLDEKNTE